MKRSRRTRRISSRAAWGLRLVAWGSLGRLTKGGVWTFQTLPSDMPSPHAPLGRSSCWRENRVT